MSRKRALPVNTKYSGEDFDTDYDDDERSNGQQNGSGAMPVQRNAANARERARMRVLSSAFSRLKTKLPWVPADTKLSKLDTLRLATIYIQQLRNSLATGKEMYGSPIDNFRLDANFSDNSNQTSLVWPFTFQSQQGSQPKTTQNFETESSYCSNRPAQHLNPWIEKELASSQCHQHWDNNSNPATYYDKYLFKTNNVNNNNSPQSEHGS